MANYYASIDLLRLKGASVRSADVNGRVMNVVMIPVDYNDIFVSVKDGMPSSARLSLNMWQVNDKFRQACIEKNKDKENYNPPCNNIDVSYSQEFREKAETAAFNRLRKSNGGTMSDDELKKAARYEVSNASNIGYMHERAARQPEQLGTLASPVSSQGYSASEPVTADDLPF